MGFPRQEERPPCGAAITMIRSPDPSELPAYQTYFHERLLQEPNALHDEPIIRLGKKPRYYAKRELGHVDTVDDLVAWAHRWLAPEDWQRARNAVRASRYKARHELVRATISREQKGALDARAKHHGMPVWRYLDALGLNEQALAELERNVGMVRER